MHFFSLYRANLNLIPHRNYRSSGFQKWSRQWRIPTKSSSFYEWVQIVMCRLSTARPCPVSVRQVSVNVNLIPTAQHIDRTAHRKIFTRRVIFKMLYILQAWSMQVCELQNVTIMLRTCPALMQERNSTTRHMTDSWTRGWIIDIS